jgi:uncharacterized RDD family membrane protein YckC
LPTTITILTPENVEVTYELAGLATRMSGAFLDSLLQMAAILVVILLLLAVRLAAGTALDNWLSAIGVLLSFAIFFGYFLYFEARWNGQTPGKRAAGTRVMKDGGFPIDLRAAMVRNVVRLIDLMPPPYAIGITSAFFSGEYKRLGDYAAGTVVVRERPRDVPRLEAPGFEGPADLPRADELYAIRHFLDRRAALPPEQRQQIGRRLALALGRLLGYPLDQVAAAPEAFLQWLVDEVTRRQGG